MEETEVSSYKVPHWDYVSKEWVLETLSEHVVLMDSQSGEMPFKVSVGTKSVSQQNVQFTDQNPAYSYVVDSEMDPTRKTVDTNDATLEQFFSRPLKIAQYEWSTSLPNLFQTFNPWQLYWENPRVVNRISNYNLLRAKMHVKIIINGNGFHYGRLIASYLPLHNDDDMTLNRAFFTEDIIQASQRPHVYLDPTTSQGGSLCLPFFWYRNALNIPLQQWRDMGEVTISTLAPLKHANGADDQVTISIFAWAEDVSMSIPTSTEPGGLVPQSGIELLDSQAGDEYEKDGPISKPATIVARVAGALTSVPVIGPFAMATQMASSTVADIARMFGYSRPVNVSDINGYKPIVLGNMANTNVIDTSIKLSLDAKQELTVDPRVTGLSGNDEMTIKSIACRESYLTQFPWSVGTAPETALFSTEVSPVVWDTLTVLGGYPEIHMPACCFATIPFAHWRGTMKYRFQIVSSTFHKGRLKVVWDPYGFQSNEYNTNYVHIIDIAEDKDFTVDIAWGSELSYLAHREPGLDDVIFRNGPATTTPQNLANGSLAIYVVNELTVPNSTVNNDILVNVFVSAGDDFEVANPDTNRISELTWFTPPEIVAPIEGAVQHFKDNGIIPETTSVEEGVKALSLLPKSIGTQDNGEVLDKQSGEESILQSDREDTTEPSAPIQTSSIDTMGVVQSTSDQLSHVHFGEAVTSFRQCLKRYNLHACPGVPTVNTCWYYRIQNNMPFHRGRAPGAIHTSADGPYNYCKMTLLNYLLPAYVGYRGGVRWKYLAFGSDKNFNGMMSATRLAYNSGGAGYDEAFTTEFGADTPTWMSYETMLRLPDTWSGNIVTALRTNPCLEIELPYMSNLRFGLGKEANLTTSTFNDYFHRLDLTSSPTPNTAFAARVACFCSVGEDFNLLFFTGAPVAYREATNPPPP